MKHSLILAFSLFVSAASFAQKTIVFEINHVWDSTAFYLGDKFYKDDHQAIKLDRLQYYLSNIKLTYDNGQEKELDDVYLLCGANISQYELGTYSIDSVESIEFAVGIEEAVNHLNPANYPDDHPLSYQQPSMHWGWSAGYNFIAAEGFVDSDGDDTPNKIFQMHATGNNDFYTRISPFDIETETISADTIRISANANVNQWFRNLDLESAAFKHGNYEINGDLVANSNLVFQKAYPYEGEEIEEDNDEEGEETSNIRNVNGSRSNVVVHYGLSYAPTIFYQFPDFKSVDLQIVDINGKVVLNANTLSNADNFFVNKELNAGVYFVQFSSNKQLLTTTKMVVSK